VTLSIELPPDLLPQPWANALWMPHALGELGQKEIPGDANNPRIQEYYAAVVGAKRAEGLDDEVPWCSAFANWAVIQAGLPGTHSLAARSWLKWGKETVAPFPGCVCVFWRDDPAGSKGHVAFYMGAAVNSILVLGGNQGNAVSVRPYPARRLLCYRQAA
jgi:uncharacterized protein (TIGR02594 family)